MNEMLQHTDKYYEEELKELNQQILKMGGVVEEMIFRSMKALVDVNSQMALEVILKKEREVNQLEITIDNHCLKMLALRQPAGSDLRFITVGLKISKDLERMGDLAVNISQRAIDLNKEPPLKPYIDLPNMAIKTQEMVKNALDAFVRHDAELAQQVCLVDDEVDELNKKIFNDLLHIMQKDSSAVSRGIHLLSIARHLERIADHATNIAEVVIFMVKGQDIRHRGHT